MLGYKLQKCLLVNRLYRKQKVTFIFFAGTLRLCFGKKDLACLYCPNATARCAIRTLTRWIKRNHELYEALAHTGYNVRTRTFMPKQVSLIVQYLDEP